ncbi:MULTISPECIES: DUF397 domain-containing protein [unclassified Streptomyces]|jgi:hypothetical protein|uniref:DUF397 domain-containing protein n=1 Tax=Streptomyces sp. NBC_00119 TaxID=2975659 RepID=A0AAU1UD23_9ACTN|nr:MULTISPECIES: DUF397 domain-containing protein [unclassified Streptomyces]MCX4644570.1 DUF397 domain-containing protein [Streptomyces sp. NBC_01446]MCX5326774.1 DUF397 domain-containing protein [Streptomyces sp. NBC_00120]
MSNLTWQKSSYCAQGDSCVHVAAHAGAVHMTESADPSGAILTATPAAFAALVRRVRVTDQKQIG